MTAPRAQIELKFLHELGDMLLKNQQPSEFQLAQARRQAEALASTHLPEWAWIGRSAVAAAGWRFDELRDIARRSIPALRHNTELLRNLAISLRHANLHAEATEVSEIAWRTDWSVASGTMYADDLFMVGRVDEAEAVLASLAAKVGPDHKSEVQSKLAQLRQAIATLKAAGVDKHQLALELNQAVEVLRELQVRFHELTTDRMEDPEDGSTTAYLRLLFYGDIEQEMALGAALAAKLCDMPDWDPCVLNLDFKYCQFEDADATT